MLTYILFIIGFVLLVKGADFLVTGSSSLAHKLDVPKIIIGLTIIAFGTSLPELIVNIFSALGGVTDISIGTVIGSNVSNIALILGITAIIVPISVRHATAWREIPYSILAAIILLILFNDSFFYGKQSVLSITDGLLLLIFFALFVLYTIYIFVKHKRLKLPKEDIEEKNWWVITLMIVSGLIGLYFGGKWVVDGAVTIARLIGVSEFVISATIIAIGTSLPELVTSLVAAYKKNLDLAVGNIIGSNIFNILLVLGVGSTLKPIVMPNLINIDILFFIGLSIVLFAFLYIGKKRELERWQGISLVIIYVMYITFIFYRG